MVLGTGLVLIQCRSFIDEICKKGIWSLVTSREKNCLSGKSIYIIQRLSCIFSDSL